MKLSETDDQAARIVAPMGCEETLCMGEKPEHHSTGSKSVPQPPELFAWRGAGEGAVDAGLGWHRPQHKSPNNAAFACMRHVVPWYVVPCLHRTGSYAMGPWLLTVKAGTKYKPRVPSMSSMRPPPSAVDAASAH